MAVEGEKNTIKVTSVQAGPTTVPVTVDSLTNLVQAAAIQIVSHSDTEVTRVQQYKCAMQVTNFILCNILAFIVNWVFQN